MEAPIQPRSLSAELRLPRPAATAPLPAPVVPAPSRTAAPGDEQRVQSSTERLSALAELENSGLPDALLMGLSMRLKSLQTRAGALEDLGLASGDLIDLARQLQQARTLGDLHKVEQAMRLLEGTVMVRQVKKMGDDAAAARAQLMAQEARKAIFDYVEGCKRQLTELLQALDFRSRDQSVQLASEVAQGTEDSLKVMARLGLTTDTDVSKPTSIRSSIGQP